LFENGYGYNTQNEYQPLFGARDCCVQHLEGSINYSLSYRTKTILSTNRQKQHPYPFLLNASASGQFMAEMCVMRKIM